MKIKYRPEIDGLRALAVLAVIIYHGEISFWGNYLSGGFLGVDIFFVISGYLITSIIYKELQLTNNFSFLNFYKRRARRILPALFLVIIASTYYAYKVLIPLDYLDFLKSAISSLFFSSNFYFYFTGIQYGAESNFLKPLLHTWSLSVEEQYYLIFPLILIFAYKYLIKYLSLVIVALFLLSFTFSIIQNHLNPSQNFYFIYSRMWEILAGSIIAIYEFNKKNKFKDIPSNLLVYLGFIMILFSFFIFRNELDHPSYLTVIPVLGTCLIILFAGKKEIVTKFLSNKITVFIGLISYSLYLWHYPIFSFRKWINPTSFNSIEKIVLIFILSILSYFFIEKQFRKKNNKIFSIKTLFGFFLIILIFNLVSLKSIGSNQIKHSNPLVKAVVSKIKPWESVKDKNGENCMDRLNNFCIISKAKEKRAVILIGDSVLNSLAPELIKQLEKKKFKIVIINNAGGCAFLYNHFKQYNQRCSMQFQKNRFNEILKYEDSNSIIILGGSSLYFENVINEDFNMITDSYKKMIETVLEKNFRVIHLYPAPVFKKDPRQILYKLILDKKNDFKKLLEQKKFLHKESFNNYSLSNKEYIDIISSINHKNFLILKTHEFFCNNQIKNYCVSHDPKNLFFWDKKHPAKFGAALITSEIFNIIEKSE